MSLITNANVSLLWQDVIKSAENRCAVTLKQDLEAYLVSMMIRFTNRPDIANKLIAKDFLEAQLQQAAQRHASLQIVGDQCLIYAGLFPQQAPKKLVKIAYFVDLGRSAYASVSRGANDLFGSLAMQFVVLMDVLQSIRPGPELLPLEAYEQWQSVGSRRALRALESYTNVIPFRLP